MKKTISLLICFCLLFSLVGCGNTEVSKAETLIENIGEISLDSEQSIIEAEMYYETLTDDEKSKVSNYSVLLEARETYNQLVYDSQTIKGV